MPPVHRHAPMHFGLARDVAHAESLTRLGSSIGSSSARSMNKKQLLPRTYPLRSNAAIQSVSLSSAQEAGAPAWPPSPTTF